MGIYKEIIRHTLGLGCLFPNVPISKFHSIYNIGDTELTALKNPFIPLKFSFVLMQCGAPLSLAKRLWLYLPLFLYNLISQGNLCGFIYGHL